MKKRPTAKITAAAGVIASAVLLLAIIGLSAAYAHGTVKAQTCTVTGKDWATVTTVTDGNGATSSEYRIQTAECGVLRIDDSLWHWQFRSADIYADLREGETYEITTYGWRIGILSQFPTIIDIE